MPTPDLTLYHFTFSHFNEKVRWALDHKGLAYARRPLLPGAHVPVIKRLTGKTQVPVLIYNGEVLPGSAKIIATLEERHPAAPLYPADPAERARALELEARFDKAIGPDIRRVAYFHILRQSAYVLRLMSHEMSALKMLGLRATLPLLKPIMRRTLRINPEAAERSRARLFETLDHIAAEVRPSGYLAGDAFSVADLAAAALLSPAIQPAELEYPYPNPGPASWEEVKATLQQHPGGVWAREIYRKHRLVGRRA